MTWRATAGRQAVSYDVAWWATAGRQAASFDVASNICQACGILCRGGQQLAGPTGVGHDERARRPRVPAGRGEEPVELCRQRGACQRPGGARWGKGQGLTLVPISAQLEVF